MCFNEKNKMDKSHSSEKITRFVLGKQTAQVNKVYNNTHHTTQPINSHNIKANSTALLVPVKEAKTHLDDITNKQFITCKQSLVGHVVSSCPMKERKLNDDNGCWQIKTTEEVIMQRMPLKQAFRQEFKSEFSALWLLKMQDHILCGRRKRIRHF